MAITGKWNPPTQVQPRVFRVFPVFGNHESRPDEQEWFARKVRSLTLTPMPKKRDAVMTVRIPSEDKEMLLKIADHADLTLSDVVVRAVRDFMEATPVKARKAGR